MTTGKTIEEPLLVETLSTNQRHLSELSDRDILVPSIKGSMEILGRLLSVNPKS